MARPKAFDRDEALQRATAVFRAKGFAGASTEDLTQAMGIGRQSLYDTFGDKKRLYLEALERYNLRQVGGHMATLRSGLPAPEAIAALLMAFATAPVEERRLGCFGVNSVCEFGVADAAVAQARKASGATLQAELERLIDEGRAKGQLDPDLDTAAAAAFINVTLAGMKVQARGGASAESLQRVAAFAVARLTPR